MLQNNLNLKISRIYPMPQDGAIKAFIDVVINDSILIKGFRIVEGRTGLFVTMPQDKGKNNRWYNTVDCLSREVKSQISYFIIESYQRYTTSQTVESPTQ